MDNVMYLNKKKSIFFLIMFLEKDHIASRKVLPEDMAYRFVSKKIITI